MIKKKKLILIVLTTLFIAFGVVVTYKHYTDYSKPILKAEIRSDEGTHPSFIKIYSSGKSRECSSFSKQDAVSAIKVNPWVFIDHTNKKTNSTYLTLNKKLLSKDKKVMADPTFVKIIRKIAKESNHLIIILNLFKLPDGTYYAFVKYNTGLSDDGTLYKYHGKLTKVCKLESGQIVRLQKIR